MNPTIAHELINERTRDMLAEARQARRIRDLHTTRRQHHTAPAQVPPIPDYVHQLIADTPTDLTKAS